MAHAGRADLASCPVQPGVRDHAGRSRGRTQSGRHPRQEGEDGPRLLVRPAPGHQPGPASEHPGASARSMVAGSGRTRARVSIPGADDAAVGGGVGAGRATSPPTAEPAGPDGPATALRASGWRPPAPVPPPAPPPGRPPGEVRLAPGPPPAPTSNGPGQKRPVQRGGQPRRQIPAVRRGRQEHQRQPARGPVPARRPAPPGSVSVSAHQTPGGADQRRRPRLAAPEPTTTA